jgi:hypothetical protein
MFVVAIPLVLVIVGMVLNSSGLAFNQPPGSLEQDQAKRAAAEAEDYRRFFDVQRRQAVKRQTRVGQFGWLLMIAIIGSFIWLYMYTVKKTTALTRVGVLQTLPTEEGKDMVLSITLKDGSNVKYLIKSGKGETLDAATKEAISNQKVSSYEISQLGAALNIGESSLPLGVAVKIAD